MLVEEGAEREDHHGGRVGAPLVGGVTQGEGGTQEITQHGEF